MRWMRCVAGGFSYPWRPGIRDRMDPARNTVTPGHRNTGTPGRHGRVRHASRRRLPTRRLPTCVFGCSFVFRAWKDPGSPKARPGSDHVMRRRATLPHPIECSTIAVPGLSFRVRNGAGRLTWAMAAANLNYHPTRGHGMARGGPGTGRWTRAQPRGSSRDHHAPCRTGTDAGIPTPHQRWGV